MITLKLQEDFLKKLDEIVEKCSFSSRTEFIRNAVREKIEQYELKAAIEKLKEGKGSMKGKVKTLTKGEMNEAVENYLSMGKEERLNLLRKSGWDKITES